MSSTYTLFPPGPDTAAVSSSSPSNTITAFEDGLVEQPGNVQAPSQDPQQYLNPFSSPQQPVSSSASPAFHTHTHTHSHTPAESVSTLSVHYQSSEFSEADDPFFGIDFNAFVEPASPSFLTDGILSFDGTRPPADNLGVPAAPTEPQHAQAPSPYLPLSPDKSPSLAGHSPDGPTKTEQAAALGVFPDLSRPSTVPHDLSLAPGPSPAPARKHPHPQLTPKTDRSAGSSDDGLAPAAAMRSPRVTVSHWENDNAGFQERQTRDAAGRWVPDRATGQSGLAPEARPDTEVESINDLTKQRQVDERNQEVGEWLELSSVSSPQFQAGERRVEAPTDGEDNIPDREIALGHATENKALPGQTYYVETGGELTREDLDLMRRGRHWEDAPVPFSISQPHATPYQPATSQEAMAKYQKMCQDTDSVVSRAATWGTRRHSLPSTVDYDVQVTGNLFKKLSLSRGNARRPSLIQGIRSIVRKPSVNQSKRSRPEADDASSSVTESSMERRETPAKLAPPSPKPGWPRKQSVPSINTAFVDVGSKAASIGASHARTNSVSATPIASPKSPGGLNLSVKKPLNRLRSKSETSGIVDLWKRSGGPPVSNLGNARVGAPEPEDEDDDDDELYEDGDARDESTTPMDDITPNFSGFQQHILALNPLLSTTNSYLVDRIAHQQMVRYKSLLNHRVKHLQAIAAGNCSCGSMCIASGGSANILDAKGDQRNPDPLSARYDGSDGDITPLEGAINQDSFPQDIPMPPTGSLPAEFECQLCFTAKKFQKPSDWTKHVHEDVQPFTCTWERCKEPKMFKRKADWVRHENEGHRHLEWWTCDVDDCRHKCYRRDNFLQHLVREHKFVEPRVKTKAAIKRAGGMDPTWAKVEQCHQETSELPQQEPCRFCGKTFPSWKKLTVHLAKHMEHISLPVLKLVAKQELDEDTTISPVQEPPPRQFPATFPARPDQLPFGLSPTAPQGPIPRHHSGPVVPGYPHQTQPLAMYPIAPPANYSAGLYSPDFDDLANNMAQAQINMSPLGHPHPHPHPHHHQPPHHQHHQGFQSLNSPAAFPALPVTSATGAYMASPQTNTFMTTVAPDIESFPALSMDALGLGLQDPAGAAGMMGGGGAAQGGLPVEHAHGHVQQHAHGQQSGHQLPSGHPQHQQQQHQHQHQQQQRLAHHQQQFSPQGSVSPYGHSPNVPQGGFY